MSHLDYMKDLGLSPVLVYKTLDIDYTTKINELIIKTPLKGIVTFSGINHLIYLNHYIYGCLSTGKVKSIYYSTFHELADRMSMFDRLFTGFHMCVVSNINPEDKYIEPLLSLLNASMSNEIPTILTTPFSIIKFESKCSPLLLSLIHPYIQGVIDED